jgi:hypothetical protein
MNYSDFSSRDRQVCPLPRVIRINSRGVQANEEVPASQPLSSVYEPSAVQHIPDGRILVAKDEKEHLRSLVSIAADGRSRRRPSQPGCYRFLAPIGQCRLTT